MTTYHKVESAWLDNYITNSNTNNTDDSSYNLQSGLPLGGQEVALDPLDKLLPL